MGGVYRLLAHHGRYSRHVEKHLIHRLRTAALGALLRPRTLARRRHARRGTRRMGPQAPLYEAHGRRTVYAHVALGHARFAAAHRLRSGTARSFHEIAAYQRRGDRRQPGSAGRARRGDLGKGGTGDLRQAPRRRCDGRRVVQQNPRTREDRFHAQTTRHQGYAGRARPVETERPHDHRQGLRDTSPAPRGGAGQDRTRKSDTKRPEKIRRTSYPFSFAVPRTGSVPPTCASCLSFRNGSAPPAGASALRSATGTSTSSCSSPCWRWPP